MRYVVFFELTMEKSFENYSRITISKVYLKQLFEKATCFQFNKQIFDQMDDAIMDSLFPGLYR